MIVVIEYVHRTVTLWQLLKNHWVCLLIVLTDLD